MMMDTIGSGEQLGDARGNGVSTGPDTRRVTLVVPTHNRANCLERTLRGVFDLDLAGREVDLHVVDDGSVDDTPATVERLRREYRGPIRFHYHRQEQAGSGAARNRGLEAATTDLVLFLDDDCVPERDWLRAIVEGPWTEDTGALAGKILSAEQDNWISRYFCFVHYAEGLHLRSKPLPGTLVDYCAGGNCAFLRRAMVEVGGFEPMLCGGGVDIDVSRRIRLLDYTLRFQPDAVVRHYHKETLRQLVRRFYNHGYRNTLYDRLWNPNSPVHPLRALRQLGRVAAWGLRGLLIPADAALYLARGVRPADAFPFAWLTWLRTAAIQSGKLVAFWRVLTGSQKLERTRPLPERMGRREQRPVIPAGADEALDRTHLTVVIPTRSRPESLRRCLVELLADDLRALRVDVQVVDGSAGVESERVVGELRERCPSNLRLLYVRRPGIRAGAARNLGLERAETDLVVFTDDDCIPQPGWLAALAGAPWDTRTAAVGGCVESGGGARPVARFCDDVKFQRFPPNNRPLSFVSSCNAAYRRAAVLQAGGFDQLLEGGPEAQGQDLARRLMHLGYRLVHQPESRVRHVPPDGVGEFAAAHSRRGAGRVLFGARWTPERGPTWGQWLGRALRAGGGLLLAPFLPVTALRLLIQGTPPAQALPFAFLGWLRRTAQKWGEASMSWRILTGSVSVPGKETLPLSSPAAAPPGREVAQV